MDNDVKICLYGICGANERQEDILRWMKCADEADYALIHMTTEDAQTLDWIVEAEHSASCGFILDKKEYSPFRFDHARNDSIKAAEEEFPDADVYFTIDMDEGLPKGWADLIRSKWVRGKHQRISYSHRHYEVAVAASRNWGHAKGWRWKYPCHEIMCKENDPDDIWYTQDQCLNLDDELEVVHYRNPVKPRSSYLRLLELRWSEYKDPASLAYLVREYYYIQCWDKIIELEPEIENRCVDPGTEACMAYVILGSGYEAKRQTDRAGECFEKAVEYGPTLRRGYIERARWLVENKRPEEAYDLLMDGLTKTVYSAHGIFVDGSDMWTWRYEDWLCVAAYWAGKPLEALIHACAALEQDPDNRHVFENVRQSYLLLERSR